MNKKISSEKNISNVSERVKNTKKEIEELKAQLSEILNNNIKTDSQKLLQKHDNNKEVKEKNEKVNPPVNVAKSSTLKNTIILAKPPVSKPSSSREPNLTQASKNKNYNVAEAREYITKQKEKRAAEVKHTNTKENQLDLKKQKLKELQMKSRELVAKNVQLKRERSSSRNRNEPIRLDTARHKSQDRAISQERCIRGINYKSADRTSKSPRSARELSKDRAQRPKSQESSEATRKCYTKKTDPKIIQQKAVSDIQFSHRSRQRVRDNGKSHLIPTVEITSPQIDIDKSSGSCQVNLQEDNDNVQSINKDESNSIRKEAKIDEVISITSAKDSVCKNVNLKDSKETQTKEVKKSIESEWFQPQKDLSYPYNFINTVKRKLQFAINSPKTSADIGIQSSLIASECKTPEPEQVRSKEEIKQLLIKSTNSSKISKSSQKKSSRKPPNLDLRIVENLELKPKSKQIQEEIVSKNIFTEYTSEDSDTSKNIPEISSESLNVSKKTSSSKKLILDGLRDLKLKPITIKSPIGNNTLTEFESNSKSDSNGYPQGVNRSYTSDFHKESEEEKNSLGSGSSIQTEIESKHNQFTANSDVISNNKSSKRNVISREIKTASNPIISDFDQYKKMITRRSDGDSQLSFHALLSQQQSEILPTSDFERNYRDISLKEPSLKLNISKDKKKEVTLNSQNKPNEKVNEIHSKFETEVSLLNDFNQSLRQFSIVEQAFENLKTQNDNNISMTKIFHNVDTQTSVITKTLSTARNSSNKSLMSSINFSRGSDVLELDLTNAKSNATTTTHWDLSNLHNSTMNSTLPVDESKINISLSNIENINVNSCAGLSLNMFDQLIKDEDSRIQQLRAIIKIREQALLDRTKSELVWLDIQKKQLIQTGKVEEASLLKKKQRGILLKHEQERNEIKKLKQVQKTASEERKSILKQQRNLIKNQLSTNTMLSKIKLNTPRERRSSGPLRVVQSCSESIRSETSISRKNLDVDEILSVTSKSMSIRVSEESDFDVLSKKEETINKLPVSNVKRTLFMREVALQKRRKTAEELLQWHRKLLDEEKKIAELEAAAESVINRIPKTPPEQQVKLEKYKFTGKQLNQLWNNISGNDDRKFAEQKIYTMSQISLERFCKSASQYSSKKKKSQIKNSDFSSEHSLISEISDATGVSGSVLSESVKKNKTTENAQSAKEVTSDDNNYTSLFDTESVQDVSNIEEDKAKIISELIHNFSKIEDEISLLSKKSERDIPILQESPEEFENTPASVSASQSSSVETKISSQIMTPKNLPKSSEKESIETDQSNQVISTDEVISEKISSMKEISSGTSQSVEEQLISKEPSLSDKEVISSIVEEKDECENYTSEEVSESVKEAKVFSEPKTDIEDASVSSHSFTEEIDVEEKSSNTINEQIKTQSIQNSQRSLETAEEIQIEENSTKDKTASKTLEIIEENVQSSNLTEEIESSNLKTSIEEEKTDKSSTALETPKSSIEEEEQKPSEDAISEKLSETKESEGSFTESSKHLSNADASLKSIEDVISSELTSQLEKSDDCEKEVLLLDEALEAASKIEESLSKLNNQLVSDKTDISEEEIKTAATTSSKQVESIRDEYSEKEEDSSRKSTENTESDSSNKTLSDSSEKTPKKRNQIDVKKRVSEILDASALNRGDKSPRLQDLYVTTYDISSAPDSNEDKQEPGIFGNEAEELWKKQLAIEQEIKQLEQQQKEQQQKEQLPYVFMREIPNKPPPPYTPPSSLSSIPLSILPSDPKEINELTNYCSKVIYKAYQNKNLEKVKFSENSFKLCSKIELAKNCGEFMFDICRDVAREHYKQFEVVEEASWLMLSKKPHLAVKKPLDVNGLERLMNRKLKELFGFVKVHVPESANIKWGRKKRDHVDDILVIESQEEEPQWINFDKDELLVKDHITNDIMKMLIDETANIFSKILSKKKHAIIS